MAHHKEESMKLAYSTAAFLLIAWTAAAPIRAEDNWGKDPQKMEEMHQKQEQKRLDRMTKELNLSADQQAAVKAALDERNAKMKDLRQQMATIHDETEKKITAALNDDQKAKYADMQAKMKEKRQEHMDKRRGEKK
jgi:hypothetical protein